MQRYRQLMQTWNIPGSICAINSVTLSRLWSTVNVRSIFVLLAECGKCLWKILQNTGRYVTSRNEYCDRVVPDLVGLPVHQPCVSFVYTLEASGPQGPRRPLHEWPSVKSAAPSHFQNCDKQTNRKAELFFCNNREAFVNVGMQRYSFIVYYARRQQNIT